MQDYELEVANLLKERLALQGISVTTWDSFDSTDFFFKELPGLETMDKVGIALKVDYLFYGRGCRNGLQ
ncbi:hypothetical protein [Pseudomonas phage LUZ7]|uniref:Uncharacterized protein n=1 Tax=Pseudomonas phage LUZ7 TaxID=655097 RepID=C8ZKC6_9CAUD|nr:hypothetical protein PP-LUZ7_gp027 [Pseudomonas phage LUZ7]CAZ66168.1 hypothetical protein [Pseudomonas phage LUZ7]